MADSHSSGDYGDVVSRRNFVALAGATGAAAIAGCLGDDDDGGDDGDDGDSEGDGGNTGSGSEEDAFAEDVDNWFTAVQMDYPAADYTWNPHQGWPPVPHDEYGLWARFGSYLVYEQEWEGHLFDDWEINDAEMVVTLRDDFTWGSNGEPVDAEDIAFHYEVEEAAGNVLFDFIDSVEATGDFEVTFSYPEGTNTDIVQFAAFYDAANHPPSVWEDLDWEDDPGAPEITQDELDPSGPLAPTDHTDDYSQTEPRDGLDDWEDHTLGENFNWNGYRVEHRDGNDAAHTSFINSEIDGVHSLFADEDTVAEMPDEITEVQIPGGFGMGFWFNHEEEPWNQREVRQAIMYSINRQAIVDTVTGKIHHPAPTGLNWEQVDVWLGSTEPDGFNVYEYDTDQVSELLDEAGVEQGDVSISVGAPSSWSDWGQAAEIAVGHLNDAGWDAEWDEQGGPGTYLQAEEEGMIVDIGAHHHTLGGPTSELPYFSYNNIFRTHEIDSEPWDLFSGYDPTEDKEIDGESYNPQELVQQLPETSDQSEREDIVHDLALIVNQDVPVVVVMEKYEQSFINEADFATPEGDNPNWFAEWPMYWLPQVEEYINDATEEEGGTPGLMKARTE